MSRRNLLAYLRCWWRRLSLGRRHFLVNLTIGLAVVLLLDIFHNARVLREAEDAAMDWVVRMRQGSVPNEPAIPLGWIDIDDKTYLDWKEPLYVPRKKLARLIDFALQTRPRMVVVDIDLAQRGHDLELDQPVVEVLQKYADKCRARPLASEDCPPVVLVASLRTFESRLPVQRTSYLDGLVDNSRHLFWASPLFDKDWDQIIRRWRIWEAVWREVDHQAVALPSIQLLAATLLTNREGAIEMEKLQNCLDAAVLKGHKTTAERLAISHEPPTRCTVSLWDIYAQRHEKLSLSWDWVARRIIYTIPWQGETPDASGGTVPVVRALEGQREGPERLLMSRVSALSVLSVSDREAQPGSADLQDRVVFIGGSFSDSRDIHASPLGAMPGVLVLMNALHSLSQYGEAQEVGLPIKLLIEVLLIALLSIAFSLLTSFWAMLLVSLTINLALVPLSVWLFGHGFWLDFALPLIAIQLYQIGAEFEEGRAARRAVVSVESPPEASGQGN